MMAGEPPGESNPMAAAADTAVDAPYRDRKRHAWLVSILVPASIGIAPVLSLLTGQYWVLWLPLAFFYGIAPIIDMILGEDRSNPPESAVARLEADRYYRLVTYAVGPVVWLSFTFGVWFLSRHHLPFHGVLATILSTGAIGGFCINLGHEMGHKPDPLRRWLAKLVLVPTGYGHFIVEHNLGHHRDVATADDPASSRMGETIYSFVLREMPGALKRAWDIESARLTRLGKSRFSLDNQVIQPMALTLIYWALLTGWLGPQVLPLLLAISFWANFQLTSANYVEHYGLLRRRLADGRLERVEPRHSWNSNHVFSNWATFHLQRHSDHHAHPMRSYQSLRHFQGVPELPNGYFGMFLISYLPPLWFRIMDPLLLKAVGRDPARINFQPRRRDVLIHRYGLSDKPAV